MSEINPDIANSLDHQAIEEVLEQAGLEERQIDFMSFVLRRYLKEESLSILRDMTDRERRRFVWAWCAGYSDAMGDFGTDKVMSDEQMRLLDGFFAAEQSRTHDER